MSLLKLAAFVAVAAVLGLIGYIRTARIDPAIWHVDPASAAAPERGSWRVSPGGAADWGLFDATPERVLTAFDDVAMAEPRNRRLAGSVSEGRITYVTRSRIFGFPDFTTVQAAQRSGGTVLTVLARLKYGVSDLGVNRARVERWQAGLRDRLARGE